MNNEIAFKELQNWYLSNCDGDWENDWSIKITTIDNPGWGVEINLEGTLLKDKHFNSISIEKNDYDWIHCSVVENEFRGYGGPQNLTDIITIFIDWKGGSNRTSNELSVSFKL